MPKKVLLIEYEPRYVERIGKLLAPLGLSVTEAHDGEAGLQAFGASRFDLVLLSGMLPRLPSAEVIREIRKKGGATAPPIVLMMSGYRGSNRKADAQKVGAFDILARPFNDEEFLGAVREAVESVDIGARTMRIDTSQIVEASPLTSSDIFSDVLEDLVEPSRAGAPSPGPAAPTPPAGPPEGPPEATDLPSTAAPTTAPARPAGVQSDIERRLRDTLTELRMGRRAEAAARPAPPPETKPTAPAPVDAAPSAKTPAPPARPKLSSDTDVDRILSDTLGGLALPRARPPGTVTPPPAAAPSPPRKREEPEAAVPSSGPDRFGQYEILERIASGGMAELSKAKRTGVEGFQKIVAIKKILPHLANDEEFITMFADEAKLAAQLNHPNIIHIYDLGKIQAGGYFIAMEYVDGRDLRTILRAGRDLGLPLPVPLAVYIASKVASALDYAHRRRDAEGRELNIVHRDVSPQNILISYEGDIKLCDFGIAKAARKASQTQSGALKGKLQYMSPEQAWGRPIDRRSDLFSLGIVLHEMLTGEHLFQGDTDIALLEKVRNADVAPPSHTNSEVPENLDAIVRKALAKDPDERYANASDLLRDLESVLYSYTPAPGSADVAIYLHRLQAEEAAVAEAKARETARAAREPEPAQEPARKRRSKGAPVSRRPAPAAPPPPPPAAGPSGVPAEPPEPKRPREPAPIRKPPEPEPEIFGSRAVAESEPERAGRAPLYIGIGVAAVALIGFLVWKLSRPQPQAAAPATVAHTPVATTPLPTVAASPLPTAPPIDQKAVEAEVQRQLALKRRELEKTAVAARKEEAAAVQVTEAAPTPEPALEAPTAVPTVAPTLTPRPQPTAVPTEPPPTVRPVLRGDLVGPGPGVVEPELEAPPRILYPPLARQQRVSGRVVVLVLVDENGQVTQAKMQQGIPGQAAVDNAVVEAVRSSRFRPATKDGIPVKMWRPVVVEVKP